MQKSTVLVGALKSMSRKRKEEGVGTKDLSSSPIPVCFSTTGLRYLACLIFIVYMYVNTDGWTDETWDKILYLAVFF